MHANTKLARFILLAGAVAIALVACDQTVPLDLSGGDIPPSGVIQGTVNYIGPPPCSQAGHVVGNAVILVFDARNPPPPAGLGVTAANFGVVPGDLLFRSWPVTAGATKICPPANAPPQSVTAPYTISPMFAGQYVIQAFFDYTGDFFATFKFRQLPEATDVGGGYIDLNAAQVIIPNPVNPDAGPVERQKDPNYLPTFLPVSIGTQGPTPASSLWDVPTFTMPANGYLTADIPVTLGATLPLSRPYFYPAGVTPAQPPISTITVNGSSATPAGTVSTPQNLNGNANFVPVLSFPQDIQVYAQPTTNGVSLAGAAGPTIISQYQSALPELQLNAGVPMVEVPYAADTASASDPFHMQLGIPNAPSSYAPGGNGGIFVWWDATHLDADCGNVMNCKLQLEFIPEAPGTIYRMWPLVVLAKLEDLPTVPAGQPAPQQPNGNDTQSEITQGTDFNHPAIIIQGITLNEDSFLNTSSIAGNFPGSAPVPLTYPDPAVNLKDHVSVLIRPSALCLDPRAPDNGGVLVTTGTIQSLASVGAQGQVGVIGDYPPADTRDTKAGQGAVISASLLSNPQLSKLVNHKAGGSSNGLMGGCLPTGRYQINLVYPTGQAWTTPNETGSCLGALEGQTTFGAKTFTDPGNCSIKPRPVLYSQGTRAVVEITPTTSTTNCKAGGSVPPVPFACTQLCSVPALDPTTTVPCTQCLDTTLDPKANPPCSAALH